MATGDPFQSLDNVQLGFRDQEKSLRDHDGSNILVCFGSDWPSRLGSEIGRSRKDLHNNTQPHKNNKVDFTFSPEPHIAFCPIFVHPF